MSLAFRRASAVAARRVFLSTSTASVSIAGPSPARTSASSVRKSLSRASAVTKRGFVAGPPPPADSPPTGKNVALAAALAGFVGCVFLYSLNAVGRSDANAQEGIEEDPLAQLKAEAQEARAANAHKRRLTPEEIEALESGVSTTSIDKDVAVEVAVAAPADVADAEEEANLKVLQRKKGEADAANGEQKKKKPWWRFGF